MNRTLVAFYLRALAAAGDEPMGDATLKAAARQAFPAERWTEADQNTQLRIAEEKGWIAGTADEFSGVLWTLTAKGKLRHAQNG